MAIFSSTIDISQAERPSGGIGSRRAEATPKKFDTMGDTKEPVSKEQLRVKVAEQAGSGYKGGVQ